MARFVERKSDTQKFLAQLHAMQREWLKNAGKNAGGARHAKSLRRKAIKRFKALNGITSLPQYAPPVGGKLRFEPLSAGDARIVFLPDGAPTPNSGNSYRRLKRLISRSFPEGDTSLVLVKAENATASNAMTLRLGAPTHRREVTGIFLDGINVVIMPKLEKAHVENLESEGAIVLENEIVELVEPAVIGETTIRFPPAFHRQINLAAAHNAGLFGEGAVIGIADTGVDPDHPELRGKIVDYLEFTAQGLPAPRLKRQDRHGHGTHVAAICSGKRTGIAPQARLKIAAVLTRVDGGNAYGTVAQVVAGYTWLTNAQVDVINCSFGMPLNFPLYRAKSASAFAGSIASSILTVAAVGNLRQVVGPHCDYPARYRDVLAVGAVDAENCRAAFSGYGVAEYPGGIPHMAPAREEPQKPDMLAPGVNVQSCLPDGKHGHKTGTSMAAPQVTGVAALILGKGGLPGLRLNTPALWNKIVNLTVPVSQVRHHVAGADGAGTLDLSGISAMLGTSSS